MIETTTNPIPQFDGKVKSMTVTKSMMKQSQIDFHGWRDWRWLTQLAVK